MNNFDDSRDSGRRKIKAFYNWMVECLGSDEWMRRRNHLITTIQKVEAHIDLEEPIESQIYQPRDDDIDWYIFVCELAWDHPYSDCAYNTKRIYPYVMAIGDKVRALSQVPGVVNVIKKMLGNNASPESQIFELLTAAHYIKNGYQVEFLNEHSLSNTNSSPKTPDMRVRGHFEFYVECKRAARQTKYSRDEEVAWTTLWSTLSKHMLSNSPWCVADVVFYHPILDIRFDELRCAYDSAFSSSSKSYTSEKLRISVRAMDRLGLLEHYNDFSVRPNSPQHELLVFGNVDSNAKRSIATIPGRIRRPGDENTVLNIFVDNVSNCVAAEWRCEDEESVDRRSRHFKKLLAEAIRQIPATGLGIVHILYETREGVEIEYLRREKHLNSLAEFDASGSGVLGVLLHAVNYYPKEDEYDWAETVQDFARIPHFLDVLYKDPLMLGNSDTNRVAQTTHWEQDAAAKNSGGR